MIIFSFPEYKYMSDKFQKSPEYKNGLFEIKRYANQEIHMTVKTKVAGKTCAILGSITPPDSNLISFLLLAHTLKKEGAKKVIALLPYFAYARHDKLVPNESLATAWVGNMLKNSGVDKIITLDLHSEKDKKLISIPITSISPAKLYAQIIAKNKMSDATLIAPDHGAIKWCEAVRCEAKIKTDIAHFEKHRTKTGIVISELSGKINPEVIIVDDMIDTGQTLLLACAKLRKAGAKKIIIITTHGIFSGNLWHKLWKLEVEQIYCTDTLSSRRIPKDKRITVIPISPLLQKELF